MLLLQSKQKWPNKALCRTAIPLCSIAAGELGRSSALLENGYGTHSYPISV
jgi:hypothetical protein